MDQTADEAFVSKTPTHTTGRRGRLLYCGPQRRRYDAETIAQNQERIRQRTIAALLSRTELEVAS